MATDPNCDRLRNNLRTGSVSAGLALAVFFGVLILAGAGMTWWLALDHVTGGEEGARAGLNANLNGRQDGLEFEKKSEFSHIKVVKDKNQRTLYFVRDNGDEVVESILDLNKPHEMVVEYTKMMFMSYLFRPKQEKVLMIGLGGGSMVHFLKHYDPNVKMDVVDIDPVIVQVADKYFDVRTGGNVNIITKDGFEFFKTTDAKYDVIYMDAFLKPSAATDSTGVALRLKTKEFYKEVQQKLNPDGLVVFNINHHEKIDDDIKTIRESFPQVYSFELMWRSLVVVASMSPARVDRETLVTRGGELDRRFPTNFSFRESVGKLAK